MPPQKQAYVQIQDEQGCYYDIALKKSQRKTIGFIVKKDGQMEMRVPFYISQSAAQEYAEAKKQWLISKHKQMKQKSQNIIKPQYEEGEIIHILGQAYRIKHEVAIQKYVEIKGDMLWVYSHSPKGEEIKQQITTWLMEKAEKEFKKAIEQAQALFTEPLGYKELKIRRMKSSWGNMRKSGLMTLNLSLIHTPPECILFVAAHELCHLTHFNHSPAFYQLMDKVMPAWRLYDHQLRNYSAMSL